MDKISGNSHMNFYRKWRSSRHDIPKMFVERPYVAARTDCTQIHRHAAGAHGKFFRSFHKFSAKAFALLRRINAEQTQIHTVFALFNVDAADKTIFFFEKQEFAGA